ncbi:MAG: hypothetical protein ACI9BW_002964 [Gammaproteobacteria bacterium]|jgi:hypothetical protein
MNVPFDLTYFTDPYHLFVGIPQSLTLLLTLGRSLVLVFGKPGAGNFDA